MSIKGVKSGDKIYYHRPGSYALCRKSICDSVTIDEVFKTYVTIQERDGKFNYPGGGLKGDGWGQWLSLYPMSDEELNRVTDEHIEEMKALLRRMACK